MQEIQIRQISRLLPRLLQHLLQQLLLVVLFRVVRDHHLPVPLVQMEELEHSPRRLLRDLLPSKKRCRRFRNILCIVHSTFNLIRKKKKKNKMHFIPCRSTAVDIHIITAIAVNDVAVVVVVVFATVAAVAAAAVAFVVRDSRLNNSCGWSNTAIFYFPSCSFVLLHCHHCRCHCHCHYHYHSR